MSKRNTAGQIKASRIKAAQGDLVVVTTQLEDIGAQSSDPPATVDYRRTLLWVAVILLDYDPNDELGHMVMAELVDPAFSYADCYRRTQDLRRRLPAL